MKYKNFENFKFQTKSKLKWKDNWDSIGIRKHWKLQDQLLTKQQKYERIANDNRAKKDIDRNSNK